MTVTLLPATNQVHDEATRQNLEFIENNGVFFTQINAAGFSPLKGKWKTVAPAGAWTNLAGSSGLAWLKDPLGWVHWRGRITGGASGSVFVTTVPVGARPGNSNVDTYACATFNGVTGAGGLLVYSAPSLTAYYGAGFTDVGIASLTYLAEA